MNTELVGIVNNGSAAMQMYKMAIMEIEYENPRQFAVKFSEKVALMKPSAPVVGGMFELMVMECLIRQGVGPFLYQATTFVRKAKFDIVLYNEQTPVALSIKRTLRERYKQAAYEGDNLQKVYPTSRTYLLVEDCKEARGVQQKIIDQEATGLYACLCFDSDDYDTIFFELAQTEWSIPEPVMPFKYQAAGPPGDPLRASASPF